MTDLTYLSLTDAIPTLDAILTSALHDRRRGDSDAMLYRRAVDAVALSGACYKTQRLALDLIRSELNIPDSIEDAPQSRQNRPGAIEGAEHEESNERTVTSALVANARDLARQSPESGFQEVLRAA